MIDIKISPVIKFWQVDGPGTAGTITQQYPRQYQALAVGEDSFQIIALNKSERLYFGDIADFTIDGAVFTDVNLFVDALNYVVYANVTESLEPPTIEYDVENIIICITDDPNNLQTATLKKAYDISTGDEDVALRQFLVNGAVVPAPTSFTYGKCEIVKQELAFSVTPTLPDNTEGDFTIVVADALAVNSYVIIEVNDFVGISTSYVSHANGTVTVTIHNNSGAPFNSQIDLILKQL